MQPEPTRKRGCLLRPCQCLPSLASGGVLTRLRPLPPAPVFGCTPPCMACEQADGKKRKDKKERRDKKKRKEK